MSTNAKTLIETAKPIGVTTKVSDLRKETEANKRAEEKPEAVKKDIKKESVSFKPSPSADARIKNLENFAILAGRYKGLQSKMDELQKFNLANDGSRIKLTLSAGEGIESFKVGNSETLNNVIKVIFKDLESRILQTEKEIQEFNI
jgi:hypothetical protein